ncbi:MAG: LysR substrate-binding domain-containing protein [Pseudomonadota bacterium]
MTAFSPSLRQLSYLVELDTQRHFGRAAANLGVAQSTFSAGIAELERLVGVSLVERTKRTVRFTDLGEAFVSRARVLVQASLALTEFAAAAVQPLTGALHLGIIPTIAPFVLPRVLPHVRARFPALTISIRETTSAAACAALHRGTLDCVLLALPFECGYVDAAHVMWDPLMLAVREGHDETVPPDVGTLLMLEDGHCLKEHGLTACGLPRSHESVVVATSIHTLIELVDAGLGSTFLPKLAVDAGLLAGRKIVALALGAEAERRITLVWPKDSARAQDFSLLAQAIEDACSA